MLRASANAARGWYWNYLSVLHVRAVEGLHMVVREETSQHWRTATVLDLDAGVSLCGDGHVRHLRYPTRQMWIASAGGAPAGDATLPDLSLVQVHKLDVRGVQAARKLQPHDPQPALSPPPQRTALAHPRPG